MPGVGQRTGRTGRAVPYSRQFQTRARGPYRFMTFGIRLLTCFRGELVGQDEYGNRYYRDPKRRDPKNNGRERRWVIYEGEAEGSKVPPVWHAWLHHMTDQVPDAGALARRPWQKRHEPNKTGTAEAYRPPGSPLAGGKRAPATGDYEPWTPD